MSSSYYWICPVCDSNINHGERCNCTKGTYSPALNNQYSVYISEFAKNYKLSLSESYQHPLIKGYIKSLYRGEYF